MTTEIVKSVGLVRCGILVHLRDGKVVNIEIDPNSPINKGPFCNFDGPSAVERLYHPNRLKYPQKRLGERGENKWQRIPWDEALNIIAEKLNDAKKRYGAESVAFIRGYRRPFNDYVARLANAFGTPNIVGQDHVCFVPTTAAQIVTYGYMSVELDPDYPPACIVWWGHRGDPGFHGTSKLIVVNIFKTEAAARADVWLQPRPATDLALALGMINVIVNEQLFDKAFVDNWTVGFDKLREHVQHYPPEKVGEITWVPAEKIVEAARLYAKVKPASIQSGNAIEDNVNSVQTSRALSILMALTGNLDIPGGNIEWSGPISGMGGPELTLSDKLPKEQQGKRIGASGGFFPPYDKWALVADMPQQVHPQLLVKAILEEDLYPIKVACLFGTNPLMTYSNAKETYKAFTKLDFSMVTDLVMTPTAALADIVLPAATFLEEDNVIAPPAGQQIIQVRRKVAQIGECWPDLKIINELAKKLGLREYFWEDIEECLDEMLKPVGMTFQEFNQHGVIVPVKEFRKYEKRGFATPSGKVELYSSLFEDWGYEPLPVYHEPPETPYSAPVLAKEYPLILTSQHEDCFYHSQDRHLVTLRSLKPEPLVIIHPETAVALGIRDGESVYIETKRGRIKQKAALSAEIDPKVVSAGYGWWFPEKGISQLYNWQESNINILTDDKPPYNPQIGSTNLRGMVCKIYKAEE